MRRITLAVLLSVLKNVGEWWIWVRAMMMTCQMTFWDQIVTVYSCSYIRHNLSLSEHLNSQVVTSNLKQRIWNACMKSTVLLYHVLLLMTTNHATAGQERRKGSARVPHTDSSLSKIRFFPSPILAQLLTYEHSPQAQVSGQRASPLPEQILNVHIRGAFKFYGLLKKRLLRPCNRGVSVVKNVYVYRVITLRNDCIFSFLW